MTMTSVARAKGDKMEKLIDAHELWAQIYKLSQKHPWKDRTNIAFRKCLDAIQFFPTVDAEPVRHGRWLKNGDRYCECSVCHHEGNTSGADNYCPNCGAKMDEVEE